MNVRPCSHGFPNSPFLFAAVADRGHQLTPQGSFSSDSLQGTEEALLDVTIVSISFLDETSV
jgi:hypothetical protein